MGQMVGADIAELRELAASFKTKAATLRTMEANLNNRIHSAPWTGHDVNNFIHNWNSTYRPSMERAATFVQSASEELLANALQQEQASEAGYTGSVGSVGAFRVTLRTDTVCTLPAPSWLSLLRNAAQSDAARTFGEVMKAVDLVGNSVDATFAALTIKSAVDVYRRAGDVLRSRTLLSVLSGESELLASGKVAGAFGQTFAVLDKAGRVLGPIGGVIGAYQLGGDLAQHDWVGAVKNGVTVGLYIGGVATVGTVAAPYVAIAAGLWGVEQLGEAAWEHREAIGHAAMAAGQWGTRAVTDVAAGINTAVDVAQHVVTDQVNNAVAGVNKTVDAAQHVVTDQVNNAVAGVNKTVDAAQHVVTNQVTQVADGVGEALNSGKKLFKHFGL